MPGSLVRADSVVLELSNPELAQAESQQNQARLKADAAEQLAREGLVPAIDLQIARDNARETVRVSATVVAPAAVVTGIRVAIPVAVPPGRSCG